MILEENKTKDIAHLIFLIILETLLIFLKTPLKMYIKPVRKSIFLFAYRKHFSDLITFQIMVGVFQKRQMNPKLYINKLF